MSPDQMKLARSRLRLGIANVGFWVLAACGGIYWLVGLGGHLSDLHRCVLIGVAVVVVQAVFDLIGGWWLMPRPRPTATAFLRRWAPGALGHTLVLAGVGLLSYASFVLSSGFALAVLVASVALAFGRSHLLRMIGGASLAKNTRGGQTEISAVVDDPAFTGGIVGFGRRAWSVLPASWRESLPESELAVESRRREWQIAKALPGRAFLLILNWNLLGASVGTIVLELTQRAPADALLGHACWMTLWTFGSLLVLPVLSGRAVFAADRAAADSGLDVRDWITRFPGLVGEDGSARGAVQTTFYPIPSAAMRLRALGHALTAFVPGNLARSNLYYSWATLTLLGRAVHCNVGRPALWVFPPSA
jgi:hypothetical protein